MAGDQRVQLIISAKDQASSVLNQVKSALGGFAGAIGALSIGAVAQQLVSVNKEFQQLKAQLDTVTGSVQAGDAAFATLEQFATKTPYQLSEVVAAFSKLKAMGLDPSEAALTAYGNTASAMGKSLDQMIEAVADAATGEFERLKEFGIRASQQGDKVTFTFKGVTTTVGKNSQEIEQYLRRIGEVEFAGAMTRQMDTIGGAASNLQDSWDGLLRAVGEGGLNDVMIRSLSGASEALISFTGLVKDAGDEFKATVEWAAAYSVGQISFWEWMTTGADEAGKKLRDLKFQMDGNDGLFWGPPEPAATGGGGSGTKGADAAKKLAEEWKKTAADLQLDVTKNALSPLDAKLADINAKAAELRKKFGEKIEITAWVEAQQATERLRQELALLSIESEKASQEYELAAGSWAAATAQFSADTSWDDMRQKYADVGSGLTNLGEKGTAVFDDLQTAVTGWGAEFSSTLNEAFWAADASFQGILESFGKMITQMLIQKQVVEPMMGAVNQGISWLGQAAGSWLAGGAGAGSGGGFTPSLDTSAFTLRHSGGPIIPRFHIGGLLADEVPTILQTGERVLSRQQNQVFERLAKALDGSGSGGGGDVQVNVFPANDKAKVSQREGPGGRPIIDIVMEAVESGIGQGRFDRTMNASYGLVRAGAKR